MQRGSTGQYETISAGGEQIRAFVPHPLPPNPPVDLSNSRQRLLEQATLFLCPLAEFLFNIANKALFARRVYWIKA